jgi:CheY-like chemotaxis protein
VDDDATVRNTVRRLLERRAFQVVQAADGQSALELFEAQPERFAMVVSDVSMPVMDGAGLLRRLRDAGHDVPVLLFSGYSVADVSAIVAKDMHSRFVQKPFSIDVLEGAMADLFRVGVP